jgi:predicted Zn-dependent protease
MMALVLLLAVDPPKPAVSPAALLQRGSAAYERRDWAGCRTSLRRAVLADPKNGAARAMLGLCEFELGEHAAALATLEKAGEIGMVASPLTSLAQYRAAELQTKAGNFERALQLCRLFTGRNEETPELVVVAGLAALRKAKFPTEMSPAERPPVIRAGRAILYTIDRRIEPAEEAFRGLVRDYPDEPNLHYAYATFLLRSDPDRGIAELREELKRQPDHLPALISLADELMKRGDLDEAVILAERAAKNNIHSFVARAIYGKALLEHGDTAAAIRELEIAARLEPSSPQVHFSLASAYAKAGRRDEAARARAEFARLKNLKP